MERVDRCKKIAAAVETLSQTETEELFRIIHKHRFDYTRNNHGVFINLSWVHDTILKQMEEYIEFCHQSKHELKKYESLCDALNTKLAPAAGDASVSSDAPMTASSRVKKDIKMFLKTNEKKEEEQDATEKTSKVSASMRFYLLKKKYSKMAAPTHNTENDLSHDEYMIFN